LLKIKEFEMNFPGSNKLELSDEAVKAAIEDALNASRLEGEDRVYVLECRSVYASWVGLSVTITTDKPTAEVTNIAEAA
jgi:hypothetical protein